MQSPIAIRNRLSQSRGKWNLCYTNFQMHFELLLCEIWIRLLFIILAPYTAKSKILLDESLQIHYSRRIKFWSQSNRIRLVFIVFWWFWIFLNLASYYYFCYFGFGMWWSGSRIKYCFVLKKALLLTKSSPISQMKAMIILYLILPSIFSLIFVYIADHSITNSLILLQYIFTSEI